MGEFRISHVRITFGRVRWRDKKAGTRVVGWSPDFFFWRWDGASTHPNSPRTARRPRRHHPALQRPTLPHLTPHRRGCPRRALFRVFAHPKVFALLFAKNASYELLRPPRGIPAILWGVRGLPISPPHHTIHHPTLQRPTLPISSHIDEDALEGLYFAF